MKLAICFLVAFFVGQAQILYQDPDGTLRIYNMKEGEGFSEKGAFSFKGVGTPLIVEKLELGLKFTAPKMNGEIATSGDPTKQLSYIQELHSEGGTSITIDTKAADAAATDLAKKRGTPPPPKRDTQSVTVFKTDRLDYNATSAAGTFKIPSTFTMDVNSEGVTYVQEGAVKVAKHYTQTIDAKGVSAVFDLNPQSLQMPLLSGTIEGPITFDLIRSEEAAKGTEVSKFSGSADRAVIDLEKERTIVLTGHVKVRGENSALIGTSEGDTVTVFLDETLNVVRVRIVGEPSKSTARAKQGGGGKK